MFVHSDGQLRAAHLILSYTPISKTFQVQKCVINAKDPCLHRISVTVLGFLITSAIPEGTFTTDPIPDDVPKVALPLQRTAKEEVNSSQPTLEGEEEFVEVSSSEDSEDDFEIFNQPLSLEIPFGDLGQPFSV